MKQSLTKNKKVMASLTLAEFNKKIQRVNSIGDIPYYSPMKKVYLYTKAEIQDALNEKCDVLCETIECDGSLTSRCYIEVDLETIIKYARKK
jgi:hypothetical protein